MLVYGKAKTFLILFEDTTYNPGKGQLHLPVIRQNAVDNKWPGCSRHLHLSFNKAVSPVTIPDLIQIFIYLSPAASRELSRVSVLVGWSCGVHQVSRATFVVIMVRPKVVANLVGHCLLCPRQASERILETT